MSTFRYPIEIGDAAQGRFERLEAWVDTGAAYTWIQATLLEQLGYSPTYRRQFRMANGQIIERGLSYVWLRIGQEIQPTLCVFGDEGTVPLLGSFTLEGFGLGVDPINRQLVPVVLNLFGFRDLSPIEELVEKGRAARAASRKLARLSTQVKNRALLNIAEVLEGDQEPVLAANQRDYGEAKADGLNEALLDRLLLTPARLRDVARDVRGVAALPDPVGETVDMTTLPNGLLIGKRRVPLGVIGIIYESRPNVTVDISVLCLKSGNACILRGGKESLHSNTALVNLIHRAIVDAGVPAAAVQFVDNTDRSLVETMLVMKDYIDLLVPRGGSELIHFVAQHATMPVVTGGIGVCHTYVDRAADMDKAANIIFNAKVRRPFICNALDTVLVHAEAAPNCLPRIARELGAAGVELHCDHRALSILGPAPQSSPPGKVGAYCNTPLQGGKVLPATEEDWGREFLSLVAAVKVVDSLDQALEHIETYGSGHSEAIVTEDYSAAMRFLDEVDAAAVYVNASTQFTDGAQFGLGAEVGISTQKFHARGPMGLRELTSYKWVIMGTGQVRE